MKKILFVSVMATLLCLPGLAHAQEPTPTPPTPYTFEPVIETDDPAPPPVAIDDLLIAPETINSIGSYAVTLWAMLDSFAGGGVLAILVIILAGVGVIRYIAKWVYQKPIKGDSSIEFSRAEADADDVDAPRFGKAWSQFGRELARRKRV